ncbi:SDR family NAD(P)-dependent oxidoreductase [Pelagibacterium mangrovi]|uniref:SDR family NAD(P)-dependent oxidoreductase n=1 Tax=Pelagibacterium mangrovi TaxID=3119828 RepID=UPI002FCA6DD5
MDLGLAGRVSLVTASSGGIGLSVARALADEGSDIVLFARSADKLAALADSLRAETGVRVLAVAGNMTERVDVIGLFQDIDATFGRLDVVVLNTGRPPAPLRSALGEDEKARWDQSYETLLAGVVQVSQMACPLMARNGWGRVVAITSASVSLPMPHHALSTVFRSGVEAFMRHLSSEVGADGITVNCIAPALIDSSHRQGKTAYTPQEATRRLGMTALGRLGTHAELAGVVCFVASTQAGFVTGETIRVDGGMASFALHR